VGGRLANAGEAASGGAAVLLVLQRFVGGLGGVFRSASTRQVAGLRLELKPTLEALTAEMGAQRTWREHVEAELGYLRGALETLLDGKPPAKVPRRRPRL
jgi:hypothetical protein